MTVSALGAPLVAGAIPVELRAIARAAAVPFPASMRDLLTRQPFSKVVRLSFVYVEPTPTFTVHRIVTASLRTQLFRMRQVYATADIGVEVAGVSSWSGDEAELLSDLDIGTAWIKPGDPKPCTGTLTSYQEALFAHRDGMAESDVAIYFVRSIVPSFAGCASHPDGVPAAAVADSGTQWTVGHEVGHVLGLPHIDLVGPPQPTKLMTGGGTSTIPGVPTLTGDEILTMRSSPFLRDAT